MPLTNHFKINHITVDVVNNQLKFPNKDVSIPHKLVKLLVFLANHPNEIITNDQLVKEVWGGVASENTRYAQIANLRKVLEDDSNNPSFLKTIPRQGYMFIAEVSEPELNRTLKPPIKSFLVFILVSLIAFSGFHFHSISQTSNPNTQHFDHILKNESVTVVINGYHPTGFKPDVYPLLTAATFTIGHQFVDRPDLHVNFAALNHPEMKREVFLDTFKSISPVIMDLGWIYDEEKRFQLYLNQNDKTYTIEVDLDSLDFNQKNLQKIESAVVMLLNQYLPHIDVKSAPFSSLVNANDFVELEASKGDQSWTRENHITDLYRVAQMVSKNPKSSMLKGYFLDSYANLIANWGHDFQLSEVNALADEIIQGSLLDPAIDKRAKNTLALKLCAQNKGNCQNILLDMLEQGDQRGLQYILDFAYPRDVNTDFSLARFTFQHWPNNTNFFNYFNSAFENNRLSEIQQTLQAPSYWKPWDIYGLAIHGANKKHYVRDFHQVYQEFYHPLLVEGKTQSEHLRMAGTSAMYIIYGLINANQLALARQWAVQTNDGYAQLHGDVMVSIWDQSWDSLEWVARSPVIKTRSESLSKVEYMRLIYAEVYGGFPETALYYFEKVFPELLEPQPMLDENNVRFSIYLMDIYKSLHKPEKANQLKYHIQSYFDEHPKSLERTPYFGLSEAQYFANIGKGEKALEVLTEAIIEEQWLPSAYWLWPPLDKDMYLSSLRYDPDFQKLVKHQQALMPELCWGSEC